MNHDHTHHIGHAHGLLGALLLTLGFAGIEAVGGWWTGSLALMADAGHMLSDALSLGLAYAAQRLARQPVTARFSYGLGRLEPFTALINAVLMLAVIAGIAYEALDRFQSPQAVQGGWMLVIAAGGFVVNLIAARLLWHDHGDMNVRAALLHVFGDLLGSVAAMIAAVVILFTGWQAIDPLLSLLVAGIILYSTVRLLWMSLQILLEGTPPHLDLEKIGQELAGLSGVDTVHDLHVWQLGSHKIALSAHLGVASLDNWPRLLASCRNLLQHRYGIAHVTLQPELPVDLPPYENAIPIASAPRVGEHHHEHDAHRHPHH